MLDKIILDLQERLSQVADLHDLQALRSEFLGKSSAINAQMKQLGKASPEERKKIGAEINAAKKQLEQLIADKQQEVQALMLQKRFEKERLDMTIPARKARAGSIHPTTQVMEEMVQVLSRYGFDIKNGPDIENDWYNFTALNIDENHPARQMHDTFYLKQEGKLLRTHTSPIQIRTMENSKPPFCFIAPGRTYRCDSDLTHTPMFHQIEGVLIDRDINMGHLKYLIIDFISEFFEKPTEVQFRPSFFPFTEPSAEVDIKMNKGDSWLEVLGCGMIHPNVLKNVGLDPNEYQGFAFGLGVERFAMLKYDIRDLRQFFEGNIDWLKHYNFASCDIPNLAGGLTR